MTQEPVLDGYLGREVVVFIDGHDIAGEFAGYDQWSYCIKLYEELVTINRRAVDMIMPVAIWERIKEERND